MNSVLFNQVAQWVGALLYAGAMGIATGQIPVNPEYAWIPVLLGGAIRNVTDATSTTVTKPQ